MRIVQILPALALGGGERMAVHLAANLQLQGHEVEFISLCNPTDIVGIDLSNILSNSGILTHFLGKKSGFSINTVIHVWSLINRIKPDVIHSHLHASHYLVLFGLFTSTPPIIHTVHTIAAKEGIQFDRFLRKTILRHRIQMVAIADEIQNTMCAFYNQPNFPIIPNGIPVESYMNPATSRKDWRCANGFQESDILLVCVARMMTVKRYDNLIEAFARANTATHVHLLLVGDGPLRPQIERQIEHLSLSGSVHLLGQRTDIASILGACDIFALASDWEGNPLAVMEAMAAGLPIISTNVGGVSELVEDGKSGILLPADDVPAFAQSIKHLLACPDQRQKMGRIGQGMARQKFSGQTMARHYFELYQNLLSKHG